MTIKVLEQVAFQPSEGVTDERFLAAVERSSLFLRTMAGFVMRQVCKQSNSGVWLDLVYWESTEAALAAASQFNSSPETEDFNRLLKKGTVSRSHYNVLSEKRLAAPHRLNISLT
jgi:hypothetical protein